MSQSRLGINFNHGVVGANVNWMDENDDGLSALHIVACKGQEEAAKVLMDAGANVNAKDK